MLGLMMTGRLSQMPTALYVVEELTLTQLHGPEAQLDVPSPFKRKEVGSNPTRLSNVRKNRTLNRN